MIEKDIYGKTLSNSFVSASQAYSQRVKPKILITFLDSRHIDSLTISSNDSYSNTSKGTYETHMNGNTVQSGYFFTPAQSMNGIQTSGYSWAVCNDKDYEGKIITANGNWYAMPSALDDNFKFGWRSNSISTTTEYADGGYSFTTSPYIEYTFTQRKVNKIKICTSEYSGRIECYRIEAYNNTLSRIYDEYSTMGGEITKTHTIPDTAGTYDIYKIKITVLSTENKQDRARIVEIVPIYEIDVTDYVISHSIDRVGELYENSIPIGGGGSASASISLDNTTKAFNPFNDSSLYGKYMKKDLKVNIYNGWAIVKNNSILINTFITSNMNTSASSMSVSDASGFLNGNATNTFTLTIAPNKLNEEIILCSTRTDKSVTIEERGYAGTTASNHSIGEIVTFDSFEYVNFGEFYIDEWTGGSEMEVNIKCLDKTKFLTEKQITRGFMVQNSTVGSAIEDLLMQTNIPRSESNQIYGFSDFAKKNAIAMYSFSEFSQDRSGATIVPGEGLRCRIWKIDIGKENTVKDIVADALDRELSALDKALKLKPYTPPSFTAYSSTVSNGINSNTQYAVDIQDFSFTANGTTNSEYFNGVIDGYYIPPTSGNYAIKLTTRNSGVRMYLDNNVIMDYWNRPEAPTVTRTLSSYNYLNGYLALDAGVPYKIRIEFYHADGDAGSGKSFELKLWSLLVGNNDVQIPITSTYTTVVEDKIGSRNVTFTNNSKNKNHYQNDGKYVGSVEINQPTGLVSEPDNKAVKLTTSSSIVIPYDESLNLVSNSSSNFNNEDFTIELYVKFPNGSFSNSGTYITNVTTANSVNYGFTFFYNNSGNGFTLHGPSGNKMVISNGAVDSDKWQHICVTKKHNTLKYYLNGVHTDTTSQSNPTTFGLGDITIANSNKEFLIDELIIYNKCLDGDTIKNRYISTQIKPLTKFNSLYGNEKSVKAIIDDISLADFGRFFVDETNKFTYYHFYRFYESAINQHAAVQKSISGNTHIIAGDYNLQLQTNKVTVKITDQLTALAERKSLWNPPSNSTLGVVTLRANISSSDTVIPVNTTEIPPFPTSGYIKIDEEIIKYTSIDSQNFLGAERGQFDTTAEAHYENDLVRESRYYEIKYESAPAFNILFPFVTGAQTIYHNPNLIEISKFVKNPYMAELILTATTGVESGSIAYIQGKNPITEEEEFTSIVGTPVVGQEGSSQLKEQTVNVAESIKKYGLKEVVIDNPYISTPAKAQEIAEFLISKFQTPVPVLNIRTIAMPQIQIGDRIRITTFDSLGIQDVDYWVMSHNISFGNTLEHSLVLRRAD